jgi:ABC-type lipoprotein release transport system permease subunit
MHLFFIITTIIAVFATIGISHKLSGLTKEERQEMKKIENMGLLILLPYH